MIKKSRTAGKGGGSKKATGRGKKRAARRSPSDREEAGQRTKTAARKTSGNESAARRGTTPRTATLDRDLTGSIPSRPATRGSEPEAGGQSGDAEGISKVALADSESVDELLEEGQAFEAGIISGVENAGIADKGGVRTRQVPVDDVPQEYLDED